MADGNIIITHTCVLQYHIEKVEYLAIMLTVLPVTLTVIHVFPFAVVLATDLNVNLVCAEVMSWMTSQMNERINERGIRLFDD